MYAKGLNTYDYIKDIVTNLNTKKVKVTAENYAVGQASAYLKALHLKDDGYITVATKKENIWYQHHYKEGEIEKNIGKLLGINDINLYVSPNSFYKPFRKIENVRKLNALYIDLDYYKLDKFKNLTPEQIIWQLEEDYFNIDVPKANFIVITGRGLAIYWLIEPIPYKALPLWNAIQKYFQKELKEIGADPKSIDATRVMRLAGSTNQKNGQSTELLFYDKNRYNLREIQKEYLPHLTPYVKKPNYKKRGKKSKVVKLFTIYKLHYARLCDIVKLQDLRHGYCRCEKGKLIKTGQREFMCFLYRYWSCSYENDLNKALEDTLDFNKRFVLPLSCNEVISQTKAAEKAYKEWTMNDFSITKKKVDKLCKDSMGYAYLGYNYTNKTLIELLNITQEEMKHLITIIDKKEVKRRNNERTKERQKAKRRNENGLTRRQIAKLKRSKLIKELKKSGLTQKAIVKKLNISIATVKRYA